jgi:molybdopterin molybdotransferase
MKDKIPDIANCTDNHDSTALSLAEALRSIAQTLKPIGGYEKVALRSALDRILAQEILSPLNVPAYANAAMDGYALRSQDLPTAEACTLNIVGTALAGQPYRGGEIGPGECVRIMTGAMMPAGADTVVMQEQVERRADYIHLFPPQKPWQNVRQAGEDIRIGQRILAPGRRLTPADIGLLGSIGVAEVKVRRRLRVAFFSTGDELRSVGETLASGQIYDSNRYTIYAMLQRLNTDIMDMGAVPDQPEAVKEALAIAANNADVIISSGGVSVGEADYVKEVVENSGWLRFWKIAIKPGRPLAFGRIKEAVFFGLPGNPVSVMVTFYQCVQPALLQLMGQTETTPLTIKVPCHSPFRKKPGRIEYQRGILERDQEGQLGVRTTGQQGSGILTSMSMANCFIILPSESSDIASGALVEVQPFEGPIYGK